MLQNGNIRPGSPDIEEYINWKASEEEKVSSLIIGSQLLQKHANEIMSAMWSDGTLPSDMNSDQESSRRL